MQLTIGTLHSSKVTTTEQTMHTDVYTIALLKSIDGEQQSHAKPLTNHDNVMSNQAQITTSQASYGSQSTSQAKI